MADSSELMEETPIQLFQAVTNRLDLTEDDKFNDPKWWAKAVADGDLDELKRAVRAKPSGLCWLDKIGRTLLHVAAFNDKVAVIKLLASLHFDLDARDEQGKTALHEAVHHEKVDAIHALIEAGAKATITNNGGLNALMYAVDMNRVASVEALLTHSNAVDANETDASGSTALHHAAAKNYAQCLAKLVEYGGKMCTKNNAGLCSANVAAYAGSADCLRMLIDKARELKYETERFMNVSDAEGNLVLHAAVDSGNIDAVKACLEADAHIDAQQEDLSTPVHFAAMRGELDIVQLMFTAQPKRVKNALRSIDKNGMTSLHKAVLFDSDTVAAFLLDQGAEIDAVDNNEHTPLLLAATKQSSKCCALLLSRGANSYHCDKDGRNIVHLLILGGANLDELINKGALKLKNKDELLNQKDYYGCTPLHYASIEGKLCATDQLLNYGAGLNVQTHSRTTALHFAAKYGRYQTCKKLLDSPCGSHIINATDSFGRTALHFASQNGHAKVVQLLLERGALFHRAYCGNTPFNLATMGGHVKVMKLMLTFNPHLLNLCCKSGNTALHFAGLFSHSHATDFLLTEGAEIKLNSNGFTFFDLALKKRNKDVCTVAMKHDRWREVLSTLSPVYPSPLFGLIEELPDVCLQVFDRCITNNNKPARSEDYAVTYDFTFLELWRPKSKEATYKAVPLDWSTLDRPCSAACAPPPELQKPEFASTLSLLKKVGSAENAGEGGENFKEIVKCPLPVIQHMLKFERVELLVSPLCSEYLNTKWMRYGRTNAWFNICSHLFAVIVLAIAVCTCPSSVQCYLLVDSNCDPSNTTCADSYLQSPKCAVPPALQISVVLLLVYAFVRIPLLAINIATLKFRFLCDLNSLLNLAVVALLMTFSFPTLTTPGMGINTGYQWNILAVATAVEYFSFILELRVVTSLGLYVVMFVEILKTLFKSALTFIFLIIGFALAFTVLFQVPIEKDSDYENYLASLAFSNPVISLMRTLVMSTGEIEFRETVVRSMVDPDMTKGVPFPVTTAIMMTIFIVLIAIAMFNLIVGLAIGDIKVVRSCATLKRIEIQVDFYSIVERYIYQLRRFCYVKDPRPETVTVYPNACCSRFSKLLTDLFTPAEANGSKAIDHAIESANRLYFQRSVTTQLEKEKQRIKKISTMMEKHVELTKLILDKLDVRWDSIESHDEGLRSRKLGEDVRSIKSNSSADWQKLYTALSSRAEPGSPEGESEDEGSPRKTGKNKSSSGRKFSIWSIGNKKSAIGVETA